jgi:hypothetical protein
MPATEVEEGKLLFLKPQKPLDLIGAHLREAWADILTAPLPQNLQSLVEALGRAMKTEYEGTAAPTDCCRSSTGASRPGE